VRTGLATTGPSKRLERNTARNSTTLPTARKSKKTKKIIFLFLVFLYSDIL
jgi:hypothetical protein